MLGPKAELLTGTLPRAHWPVDTPGAARSGHRYALRRGLLAEACWTPAGRVTWGFLCPFYMRDPGRVIPAGGQTPVSPDPQLPLPTPPPNGRARAPQSSQPVSPCHALPVPSLQTTALPSSSKATGSRTRGVMGGARGAFHEAVRMACGGWIRRVCASYVQTRVGAGCT